MQHPLDERARRLWAATEALDLKWDGVVTIRGDCPDFRGVDELLRHVFDDPISVGTIHAIVMHAVEHARRRWRGQCTQDLACRIGHARRSEREAVALADDMSLLFD